jgi:hypothetical protein
MLSQHKFPPPDRRWFILTVPLDQPNLPVM